ncbi:MAG TPA: hypothetical protein VHC00_03500 [Rhizobiaceae bacterium]|nr:hypothetical protein [Rhizobiaceae bacterium]
MSFRLLHLTLFFKLPLFGDVMPGYAATNRAYHGMMMSVVSGHASATAPETQPIAWACEEKPMAATAAQATIILRILETSWMTYPSARGIVPCLGEIAAFA